MPLALKRRMVFFIWFFLVLSPFITIFQDFSRGSFSYDTVVLLNMFQRLTGMLAFTLLFMQVFIGAHMDRWLLLVGAKAFWVHTFQGIVAYGLVLSHPMFESLIVYEVSKNIIETLLVFVPSFGSQRDILMVYGRMAFVLVSVGVFAGYFRAKPFIRRNWRTFHILNYFAFYSVWYHARIGTDISSTPFVWVYWGAFALVSLTVAYRFISPFFKNLKLSSAEKTNQKA